MTNFRLSTARSNDTRIHQKIETLLQQENIKKDSNLDYTCYMINDDYEVVATGSLFGNTLRCLAVNNKYQGEGLLNQIVTHLMSVQYERGNTHLFVYTKIDSAKFFESLGFYTITKIDQQLVFMENKRTGFTDYLNQLKQETPVHYLNKEKRNAAIVMNANPFTLGHLYLLETASKACDCLHLFVVSEDASLVPFETRKKLIIEGSKHLTNIIYHDSGSYIISSSTFPSYFQKDEESVIKGHALLDLSIFKDISATLAINVRYVGNEPTSFVTNLYNQIMATELPKANIECIIIERKEINKRTISASIVRQAIKDNNLELLLELVPQSTYDFFMSDEAKPIIEKIQNEDDVLHY